MSNLILPHGSEVVKPLILKGNTLIEEVKKANSLLKVTCSSREVGDIIMLGIGGFTPLTGFMYKDDWKGVCDCMTMAEDLFWPIPITLSTDFITADSISLGTEITLVNRETDEQIATMVVNEKYIIDKIYECNKVFKTSELDHPGVAMVMSQGDVNLAGPIKVLSDGGFPSQYGDLYMTPAETRDYFKNKGWSTIAALQTRNPMHRSHEYLVKIAIEICDGVMIHSTLGNLKEGDIPADVRTEAINVLVNKYFVKNTVVQSGHPVDMRYAGPREALLHALFRQNYGCSHLIVGRDHAGVGNYYGSLDAQNIFNHIEENSLLIQPIKINRTFWCNKCGGISSMKTCPHSEKSRETLSGTKLRHLLSNDLKVSENLSRPEVLEILRNYYARL
jgi:sulfate adenylyltransferase